MAKILIAEDEKDITFIIDTALKKAGYETILAYDGEEALEKAINEKPDLILLDIMMPKMDGFTVNTKLKENEKTKDIPVIVCTAKGGLKDLFNIEKKWKIDGYLEKPFVVKVLVEKVKEIIGEKK
ncbi:MAG: response regulator [Candidatus Firestonebacteria bacterium]